MVGWVVIVAATCKFLCSKHPKSKGCYLYSYSIDFLKSIKKKRVAF